jgi:hypothetical protein
MALRAVDISGRAQAHVAKQTVGNPSGYWAPATAACNTAANAKRTLIDILPDIAIADRVLWHGLHEARLLSRHTTSEHWRRVAPDDLEGTEDPQLLWPRARSSDWSAAARCHCLAVNDEWRSEIRGQAIGELVDAIVGHVDGAQNTVDLEFLMPAGIDEHEIGATREIAQQDGLVDQ